MSKKIWNAKNLQTFLDDISKNWSLCNQGQQSYLYRPGQVMMKSDRSTACFFHVACFPTKNIAKNCKFWKKSVFWCHCQYLKTLLRLTDVLWMLRRNVTDQLRVFSMLHVSQQKILQKIANIEKNQCFGATVNISGLFLRLTDVLFLK